MKLLGLAALCGAALGRGKACESADGSVRVRGPHGLKGLVLGVVASLLASAAFAGPVNVVFRGSASGTIFMTDQRAVGFANAPIGGFFTYDPSLGVNADTPGVRRQEGGVMTVTVDPVSFAAVVFKGIGLAFVGDDFFGYAENSYAGGHATYRADTDSYLDSALQFTLTSPQISSDLSAGFHAIGGDGWFNWEDLSLSGPVRLVSGSFTISDAYVGNAPPGFADLPEPSVWALMVLGFGSVAAVLRWRRSAWRQVGTQPY